MAAAPARPERSALSRIGPVPLGCAPIVCRGLLPDDGSRSCRAQNTCGSVTVMNAVTTVAHVPGSHVLSLTHAGNTYTGTIEDDGRFSTEPQGRHRRREPVHDYDRRHVHAGRLHRHRSRRPDRSDAGVLLSGRLGGVEVPDPEASEPGTFGLSSYASGAEGTQRGRGPPSPSTRRATPPRRARSHGRRGA